MLSSSLTPVFKIGLPIVWLGGFSLVTLVLFFQGDPAAWGSLLVTVVGAVFLLRLFFRLKHVEVDGRFVYVTNFRRRIAVPLAEIDSVQQNRLLNVQPAFIVFREKTAFGRSVMFMPLVSMRLFREDRAVEKLRRRVGFEGEWRPKI